MAEQYTIIKNKPKPLSQDYEALRLLGLKYIEQFSKDIWTDYNTHDPGITTMELLEYVITDLAYRTDMPMEDILARITTDTVKDFFTAREILPCNPVTFDDLRKKSIDVEGVENAWILPYTDTVCSSPLVNPAYFIKCNPIPGSIDLNAEFEVGFEPRNINGLYHFNLLLEEDAVLGDLNILSVDWEMRDPITGVRRALVRFIFPLNMGKVYPGKQGVNTGIEKIAGGSIMNYTVSGVDFSKNTFDLVLNPGLQQISIPKVAFHVQPVHTGDLISTLKTAMWAHLSSANPVVKADVIAKILSVFSAKVKKVSSIIDEVYCMYEHIRNLCEDVIKIGIVPSQEIAVCANIETDNAVDLEEILGQVYFAIDVFFSPPVRFYLLKELLQKGYPSEIIFEGPLLRHGFILDEDLRKRSLFSEIHVSDLYNIIMSIPGVKTIKYLQITNYYNGIPLTEGEFWKLVLNQDKINSVTLPISEFHLNLDRLRSKITFYKGNMPIIADKQVANRIYNDLKASLSKPRINPDLAIINDILPPIGQNYKLDEYYSVQNEFPFVYGVNRDGIPSDADIIRKTKIKQLKGYLLFFDQILANYLSQLDEIKNLYATGNSNNKTYFSQPVYDTPIPDLTEDDNFYSNAPPPAPQMPDSENLNFYGTAALIKDFATPSLLTTVDIDDTDAYAVQWKAFANGKKNAYRTTLEELTEPEDDKLDRRNRFLDHLLARFAESFSDYAAMMYKFTGNMLESNSKKTAEEIANDKFNFLQQYHILSYNRGKGQYYKCCPTGECAIAPIPPATLTADDVLEYDTYKMPHPSNPTGLHKRTSLMLGMNIHDNSNLALNKFFVLPSGLQFQFVVQYDGAHQLVSVNLYATDKLAFAAMEKIVELMIDEDNPDTENVYFEVKPFGGGHRIEVKESMGAVTPYAVSTPVYATPLLAQEAIKSVKKIFVDEGMKVIDHLLLRALPTMQHITAADLAEGFFPLCADLNPDCDCPVTDYYSFRISVILPYWTQRFRNMDFRAFAEDTIHRETPAHILPKFCWVSMYDMHRFEKAYTEWFAENKNYKPNMNVLRIKLRDLIKTMNTMTNVYPVGHLHDCDNPSTDNPVILSQTILGTF
ncbi:hypothetical protein [Segetibacter aerophilus]|uniref:Uncharacterized protein n=1 Tax=Segetibacter aerophilus TaxID=670293 RepID=A0A512BIX9_9BACT|nr:hypothetical protein [Segetibacter aerophilus]GEO11928.1 hypothetical protein SAE01_44240 [Segetibacter aerophilus]